MEIILNCPTRLPPGENNAPLLRAVSDGRAVSRLAAGTVRTVGRSRVTCITAFQISYITFWTRMDFATGSFPRICQITRPMVKTFVT